MKKTKLIKKVVSIGLVGTMLATLLSGCSMGSQGGRGDLGEDDFTIWSSALTPDSKFQDYTESPFHQNLAKNVGKNLIWDFPTTGTDGGQAFNLMIAGGELPDIIIHTLTDPQSYIDQGIILPLNEYIEGGKTPNLKKYLDEHPEIDKAIKTDNGDYYMFPWARNDDWLLVFRGPAVRKDWLEECGLEEPVTLKDYDKVARAFHDKYGAKFATVDDWFNEGFMSAFDTVRYFYLDDNGDVAYGPAEDNFREYLEFLHKWYEDGILDKDLPSIDGDTLQKKILNDEVGVTFTSGNTITKWQEALEAAGSDAEWIGTSFPRKTADATVQFSQMAGRISGLGGMITSQCHDIEGALKILDYAYGEEGYMFWNFGVEGDTYTMVDGEPVYTDKIMKSPDGVISALGQNIGSQWSGPCIQDKRMYSQKSSKEVNDAIDKWAENTNVMAHQIPRVLATQEETDRTSNIATTLGDYMKEMYFKFIQGQVELNDENWDAYVKKLYDIGLQELIDVKTEQVERFNNR